MVVIASGQTVILRDGLLTDADDYIRWMKRGEWMRLDAPWETGGQSMTDEEIRKSFSERFLHDLSLPRKRAIICTKEKRALGWVNRYGDKRFPSAWSIGIDICEDDYLNKGVGTEALRLWIDYLFSNSDFHRIAFDTYSFNKRMTRTGGKLGFVHEGTDRQIIFWQNEWVDRLHFGLLREEWEKRGAK